MSFENQCASYFELCLFVASMNMQCSAQCFLQICNRELRQALPSHLSDPLAWHRRHQGNQPQRRRTRLSAFIGSDMC
jgi:hypothetical protein